VSVNKRRRVVRLFAIFRVLLANRRFAIVRYGLLISLLASVVATSSLCLCSRGIPAGPAVLSRLFPSVFFFFVPGRPSIYMIGFSCPFALSAAMCDFRTADSLLTAVKISL